MRVLLAALVAAAGTGHAAAHPSVDTKLAKASLLTTANLGKGWSGKPTKAVGIDFSCKGVTASPRGIRETAWASSPAFTYDTTGPFVSQTTGVFATARQASTYWRRGVTTKLARCVARSLGQVSAKGVRVKIRSETMRPFTSAAGRSASYRVVATLSAKGHRLTDYFDVVLLADGREITEITVSSFQSPPPLKFEQILAHDVVQKFGGPAD